MRSNDVTLEVGTVFDWDLSEIQSRLTGDVKGHLPWRKRPPYNETTPEDIVEAWEDCKRYKRDDFYYEDLKNTIALEGFTKPLRAIVVGGQTYLSDGHHRVCVAEDLGMHTVPVVIVSIDGVKDPLVYNSQFYEEDSGSWGSEDSDF